MTASSLRNCTSIEKKTAVKIMNFKLGFIIMDKSNVNDTAQLVLFIKIYMVLLKCRICLRLLKKITRKTHTFRQFGEGLSILKLPMSIINYFMTNGAQSMKRKISRFSVYSSIFSLFVKETDVAETFYGKANSNVP